MSNQKTRPAGIVAISIMSIIGGFTLSIIGLLSLLGGNALGQVSAVLGGFFTFGFGVASMVLGYGLWMYADWGYNFTKLLYVISIPLVFISLIMDFTAVNFISSAISIALCVWVLIYLNKDHIADLFNTKESLE